MGLHENYPTLTVCNMGFQLSTEENPMGFISGLAGAWLEQFQIY